jgi:hypothetical protein
MIVVNMTPAMRPRPMLASEALSIAEDPMVLVRREKKSDPKQRRVSTCFCENRQAGSV